MLLVILRSLRIVETPFPTYLYYSHCEDSAPFVVGHCLQNLTDLESHSREDVHVKFVTSVLLERFVVIGSRSPRRRMSNNGMLRVL
ncbi:hypothetical protein WJX75_005312 [Coccomyxa subellipsoidea]|uniref:Uncharacterized protein n=1 Tax=Coccomyxa subellipsoidea TaxID=248742 RepID=A0ABR2Z1G2_9CHLO